MTYQHLISQVRLAREIAGKPLTSYKPLVDDPEAREVGNSDPTPAELLERLAEVRSAPPGQFTGRRRQMDERQQEYEVPEIKQGYRRSGVDLNRGEGELNIGTD